MDAQRREAITEWSAREFTDGVAGLRRFADRGVSGAVTDGSGWLFLFEGRVVGTVDTDLEAFTDADIDGTVYEAPDRSLPVLFAMRERGGRERAQYYTEDTPLADADQTLSAGGFTGYIELSEHVLSGDYYVVYAAGESMASAFVGNARRLETGEDAFALAADEVGIYTVYEVDLDVQEIPRPAEAPNDGPSTTTTEANESVGEDDLVTGGDDLVTGSGDAVASDDEPITDDAADPSVTGETPTPDTSSGDAAKAVDTTDAFTDAGGTDDAVTDEGPGQSDNEGAVTATEPAGNESSRYDIPLDADWTTDPEAVADPKPVEETTGPRESSDRAADDDPGYTADLEPETDLEPDVDIESDTVSSSESGDGVDPTVGTEAADVEEPTDLAETATGAEATAAEGASATEETADSEDAAEMKRDESVTDSVVDRDDDGSDRRRSGAEDDVFSEEAAWRETASTPTLESTAADSDTRAKDGDPGRAPAATDERMPQTAADEPDSGSTASDVTETAAGLNESVEGPGERTGGPAGTPDSADDDPATTVESSTGTSAADSVEPEERLRELRSALASVTSERDDAIARRDAYRTRYEQIAAERDELVNERDELRGTVEELRSEVTHLREALADARDELSTGDEQLSPAAALDGTNLFIRYGSRTGATLEAAHDGERDRSELRENLQIEHHTTFETDGLTVDGEPFESFLHGTIAYRFTQWLTEDLLFEIAATDNAGALRALYDALPELDRAEIDGSVSVVHRENGEEVHDERSFDLVFRDRMGNPLFGAELNDSRSPTGGGSLESLVASGGALAASNDSFAGAFAVTASFFEPDALEVAGDAVGGGLFSRSSQKGFVKLSRKRGYHLCLVESRDGAFHLTLPDL